MKRKIVRVGASLCILLPKDIIRMMGWDFGDEIDLILDEENERVILRNPREEVKKKQSYLEDFDSYLSEYKDILKVVDAD